MTTLNDLPRVVPASPSWLADAPRLADALEMLSTAATAHPPGVYLLEPSLYWDCGRDDQIPRRRVHRSGGQ